MNMKKLIKWSFVLAALLAFKNIAEPIGVYRLKGDIQRNHYQITPTVSAPTDRSTPNTWARKTVATP